MGERTAPSRSAVWYAVASCEEPLSRWSIRVTMTVDADGGAREDRNPPTIDAACELLRTWYRTVTQVRA